MVQITSRFILLAALCAAATQLPTLAEAAAISARRAPAHSEEPVHHAVHAASSSAKHAVHHSAPTTVEHKGKSSTSYEAYSEAKEAGPSKAKSSGAGSRPGAGKAKSASTLPLPARVPRPHDDESLSARQYPRAAISERHHHEHDYYRHAGALEIVMNGEHDRVRVGDRVFSSRILGRRAPLPLPEPHHHHHDHDHDHGHDDVTKVVVNGDNDRVRVDRRAPHHHHHDHHYGGDYDNVIVNGDHDRVRVDRRTPAPGVVIPGDSANEAYMVSHVDGAKRVVLVDGDNKTVHTHVPRQEPMRIPGSIDIMSPSANSDDGVRLASLFLVLSDNATYFLDASTHNHTQISLVVQPPTPDMVAPLSLVESEDEVPVLMEIEMFDKVSALLAHWCATYNPKPVGPSTLQLKPCADAVQGGLPPNMSQTFLWNKKNSSIRPLFFAASNDTSGDSQNDDDEFAPDANDDAAGAANAESINEQVTAFQSTYAENSSRPPIMAAAAVEPSKGNNKTAPSSAPSAARNVTLVFRPDAPSVAAHAEGTSDSTAASSTSSAMESATASTSASSSAIVGAAEATMSVSSPAVPTSTTTTTEDAEETATPWTSAPLPTSAESSSASSAPASSSTMNKLLAAKVTSSASASTMTVSSTASMSATASAASSMDVMAMDASMSSAAAASSSSATSSPTGSMITLTSTTTATRTETFTPSASSSASPGSAAAQDFSAQDASASDSASTTSMTASSASAAPTAGVLDIELVDGPASVTPSSSAAPLGSASDSASVSTPAATSSSAESTVAAQGALMPADGSSSAALSAPTVSSSAAMPTMTPVSTAPYMWKFRREQS